MLCVRLRATLLIGATLLHACDSSEAPNSSISPENGTSPDHPACDLVDAPWDFFRQKVKTHTKDRLPIICPQCEARDIGPQLICEYTTEETTLFEKPFWLTLRGTVDLDACGSPATLTGKFEIDLPGQLDDTATWFLERALESEAPEVQYDQENNAFFVEQSISAGWMREKKVPVVAVQGTGKLVTIMKLALESPGQGVLTLMVDIDFCLTVAGIEVCGAALPDLLRVSVGNPPFELMNLTSSSFFDYCPPETTFEEVFDWENWPVPGLLGLLIRIYIIATSVFVFLFLLCGVLINACKLRSEPGKLFLVLVAILLWPVFPATSCIGVCLMRCGMFGAKVGAFD